jgi:membrane-bound serine protease (ClpP class)
MIGGAAVASDDFERDGMVRAFSENWQAQSVRPVRKGERLRITAVEGLLLKVEPEDKAT